MNLLTLLGFGPVWRTTPGAETRLVVLVPAVRYCPAMVNELANALTAIPLEFVRVYMPELAHDAPRSPWRATVMCRPLTSAIHKVPLVDPWYVIESCELVKAPDGA